MGELGGLDLGDPRRVRRALDIMAALAEEPEASLPGAMEDEAALEAAYRHLSNDAVGFDELLAPHWEKTAARVTSYGEAYAIHDTTAMIFPGESRRKGLSFVSRSDQGFLAHVTLAVSTDGGRIPLGVLSAECWTRQERKGRRSTRQRRKEPQRESQRWARGISRAEERVAGKQRLIHVADRECDIYELLATLVTEKRRFIIRAAQDRVVDLDESQRAYLFSAARETQATFAIDVPISARKKRRDRPRGGGLVRGARTARLSFAATRLEVRRAYRAPKTLPEKVAVNVVHVFELRPPPGQAPVEWLLLTSEPVDAREDVERIVAGYRTRWTVEDYFKAVKTGCGFESRQLESMHALVNLLAYSFVVAYVLLLMRALSRAKRAEPASALLSHAQLEVLRRSPRTRRLEIHTLPDALRAIAAMGGHIKNNGDPGWRVLSRGWRRLAQQALGYELAMEDL